MIFPYAAVGCGIQPSTPMAVANATRMNSTVRVWNTSRNVPMNGTEISPPTGRRMSNIVFICAASSAESR